jgi:hypothetical protein
MLGNIDHLIGIKIELTVILNKGTFSFGESEKDNFPRPFSFPAIPKIGNEINSVFRVHFGMKLRLRRSRTNAYWKSNSVRQKEGQYREKKNNFPVRKKEGGFCREIIGGNIGFGFWENRELVRDFAIFIVEMILIRFRFQFVFIGSKAQD